MSLINIKCYLLKLDAERNKQDKIFDLSDTVVQNFMFVRNCLPSKCLWNFVYCGESQPMALGVGNLAGVIKLERI